MLRRIACAVLASFLVLAPIAASAALPTAEQTDEARKYFDAGLAFYKAGRFSEALAAFLEANRVTPRESIQRNIAQTHRDLRDFASAHAAYEELLATYGAAMKPADRANAERARDELATLTGLVSVTVPTAEARIVIDGRDAGHPPVARRLNPGSHKVNVTMEGFAPLEQTFDIAGHDTISIAGPLVKAVQTGHVEVSVLPAAPVANVSTAAAPTPPPPVAVSEADTLDPWRGLYTRIELMGLFALGHHDTVEDRSVYGANVVADGSGLFGGGVGVHVGYSLGEIGLEGLLQLAYDHSSVEAAVDPTRTDKWTFHRPGGTLAAMARWLPKMGQLRPTAGFGLGLSGRAMGYTRAVEGTRDKLDLQFYMTPTMILDGGLMIGKTPGGKLFFGLQMLVDLPSRQTIPSGASKDGRFPIPAAAKVQTSTGPEVFIGPVFGLVFGH